MATQHGNPIPQKISDKHRVLMRLLLCGMKVGEAARAVGLHPTRASTVVNSPLFLVEKERMRVEIEGEFAHAEGDIGSKVRHLLERQGIPSAEKLVSLRDTAEDEKTQLAAARDILDRLGVKGKDTLEIQERVVGSPALESMLATAIREMQERKSG